MYLQEMLGKMVPFVVSSADACRVSKKMHKVLQQNPACEIQVRFNRVGDVQYCHGLS